MLLKPQIQVGWNFKLIIFAQVPDKKLSGTSITLSYEAQKWRLPKMYNCKNILKIHIHYLFCT